MDAQTKLVDRIKKLLALSGNNSNKAEAELAAAKAQSLLMEHNLRLEDISFADEAERYEREDVTLEGPSNEWVRQLMWAIVKGNLCSAIWMRYEKKMAVLGKPSNIEVVKYLHGYLVRELRQLCDKDAVKIPADERRRYRTDWYSGAVLAIRNRMSQQQHDQQAQTSQGAACTALVVRTTQELKEFESKLFPKLVTGRTRMRYGNGFNAGRAAGQRIPLNKGIGGSQRQIN